MDDIPISWPWNFKYNNEGEKKTDFFERLFVLQLISSGRGIPCRGSDMYLEKLELNPPMGTWCDSGLFDPIDNISSITLLKIP